MAFSSPKPSVASSSSPSLSSSLLSSSWWFGRPISFVFLAVFALSIVAAVVGNPESGYLQATFVNQFPETVIELYWENHADRTRRLEATVQPRGGWHVSTTFLGHEFSYDIDGTRHYITVDAKGVNALGQSYILLAGNVDGFLVKCNVSVGNKRDGFEVLVKPHWAPRGASRFLELVRRKYYDGVVFHRMVPNLLTQFGIARDFGLRTEYKHVILDDLKVGMRFEPGYLSFAGSGHDSRTTEVFIANPGASEAELNRLGEESWETPFGHIYGSVNESVIPQIYSEYGDMVPFGNGPDSNKIYEIDGYSKYLPQNFPKLDYIERCYIVDEEGPEHVFTQGEL